MALMLALTAALLPEMLLARFASICALRSTADTGAFASHGIARPGVVLGAMEVRLGVGTPSEARAVEEGARDERCLMVGAGAREDLRDAGAASDLRDLPMRFFLACGFGFRGTRPQTWHGFFKMQAGRVGGVRG